MYAVTTMLRLENAARVYITSNGEARMVRPCTTVNPYDYLKHCCWAPKIDYRMVRACGPNGPRAQNRLGFRVSYRVC
jgi:hypothetical protein